MVPDQCCAGTGPGPFVFMELQHCQLIGRQFFGNQLPQFFRAAFCVIMGQNESPGRRGVEVCSGLSTVGVVDLFPGVINLLRGVGNVEFLCVRQGQGIDRPGQTLLADL